MKNKIFKFFVLGIMMIATGFVCNSFYSPIDNVYAETNNGEVVEPEPTPEQNELDIMTQIDTELKQGGYPMELGGDIVDSHLYSALWNIVSDYIKSKYDYVDTRTTIYNTMFKQFKSIEIGEMAIETLAGMQDIKFDNLETLTINQNLFQQLPENFFKNMPKLKTLNLASNQLSEINLYGANQITTINLSSNSLKKIDFSNCPIGDLDINLAGNKFSSMEDIILPTRVNSIKLNLINNNITNIDNKYFDYSKLTMNLGVQLGKKQIDFTTTTPINIFKTNLANVSLKLYKVKDLEDVYVKTITDDFDGNSININDLKVGEYYLEYYLGEEKLYNKYDINKSYYENISFKVLPTDCVVKYEHKGKIYDSFDKKVTGKVKVILTCEEGGKIFYSVNGDKWIEGNEVLCDKGGTYSIKTKVVIDNIESKEQIILVKTSLNTVFSDGLMFALLVILFVVIFVIIFPLINKKWYK